MKSTPLLHAFLIVLAPGIASGAVILGPFAGSWDGSESVQNGRIFRDGIVSSGEPNKTFPGVFGGSYLFQAFSFYNSGPAEVITVDGIVSSAYTHLSTFSGLTYFANFSENEATYLGDIGSSVSQSFSFLVPADSHFMVVASTNNQSLQSGETFSFTVSGNNIDNGVGVIPEPASLLGLAGLLSSSLLIRRRGLSRK